MKNHYSLFSSTSLILVILTSLLIPSLSYAQTLKAGIVDFRPFMIVKKSGELGGSEYEKTKLIIEKARFKYTVEGYPTKRLYTQLSDGRTEIFIGLKNSPIYHDHVLYSQEAVNEIKLNIYGSPGIEMPGDIQGVAGQKIIGIKGYGYGGIRDKILLNPETKVQLFEGSSHENCLKMLQHKRGGAQLFLGYEEPSKKAMEKLDIQGFPSVKVFAIKTYIIVSKKTPNADLVLEKLEKAYSELKANGKL